MMKAKLMAWTCLIVLFPLLAATAAAQAGASPASIVGQVKDTGGGVLPGVTVKATSPALQVPELLAVTDDRGEYRLTPLPLGTYALEFTIGGFQTLRRTEIEIRSPGFIATLNQTMSIGAIEETVIVAAASPMVDVRTPTVGTNLTQQAAELIASTRDGLLSYANLTPGVRGSLDVGGSQFSSGFGFTAYGQTGQRWSLVEGIVTSQPRGTGAIGQHFNFDSVEAVRIESAGHSAEVPTRGVMIDTAYKSGGNEMHGQFSFDGTSGRFRANNIDDELRRAGVIGAPRLHPMTDSSGTLGGKIIQDKLWYVVGGRYRQKADDLLGAFYPDGTAATWDIWQRFLMAKLSYQLNQAHKIIGFYHDSSKQEVRGASALISTESMVRVPATYTTSKVEWQAIGGNTLTLSVLQGRWFSHATNNAVGDTPRIPRLDIATQRRTGDVLNDGNQDDEGRNQTRATMSLFRPSLFAGDHEFKAGFDHHRTTWSPIRHDRRTANYQLVFDTNAPFAIDAFNYPTEPMNRGTWTGIYFQDRWTMDRRLTLELGVRYDHDNARVPEQCRVAGQFASAGCFAEIKMPTWSMWSPRVLAAYDLLGDAKNVVKASFGRYMTSRDLAADVAIFNPFVNTTTRYRWRDNDDNRDWSPGESILGPTSPDIISSAAGVGGIVNMDLKPMTEDQFMLALEREVVQNVGVRIVGYYSIGRDTIRTVTPLRPYSAFNIPITAIDPGPDGEPATTADNPGTTLRYWDYSTAFRGAAFDVISLMNDPNADRTYKTIEAALSRRLAGGWQFSASYSATLKDVPVPSGSAFNPNAEINTVDNTWDRTGRLSGSYEFPLGIIASTRFEYRSGEPLARQVLVRGGAQIPNLAINAEPIGSLRLEDAKLVDIQLRKRFSLSQGRVVDLRGTLSNVLNTNPVQALNVRAGSTYLLPSEVLLPRIAQFGVQFSF